MNAPDTPDQLFDTLAKSRLLSSELFAGVHAKIQKLDAAKTDTPRKVAATLARSGILTPWQARSLLTGKTDGYYIGRYKLLEVLGSGGMGHVYLAEHLRMHQMVAMKVLRPVSDRPKDERDEILARFTREARAIAALHHPNIVQAFDFDDHKGTPYLVMEFVEGTDAERLVMKSGAIPWKQATDYICQAAAGLHHAHQAGLVHRDVKPGNLLIDRSGHIKLLDLGLVSCLSDTDDSLTIDEGKLGSVDFIAPEQAINSHDVDARADIYGLGGTFYRMLSGQLLYPGLNTTQKLLAHQTKMPQPIAELLPNLPAPIAAAITRMLAKDKNDRFETAGEIEALLQPFAEKANPAFEDDMVKHTRTSMERFLKRSPDEATLAESPTEDAPIPQPASATPITDIDSLVAADSFQFVDSNPQMTNVASRRALSSAGRKNKGKKKRKSSTAFLIGSLAVLVVATGVIVATNFGSGETPETAKAENPDSGDPLGIDQSASAPVTTPKVPNGTSNSIRIAAVLPKPTSDHNGDGKTDNCDEYVVIENTGDSDVDISGYLLSDRINVRHAFTRGTILGAGATLRVYGSDLNTLNGGCGNGIWNNDSEDITLANPKREVVDEQKYNGSPEDKEVVFPR